MNKIHIGIAFIVGAAVGSTATWFVAKNKYEKLIADEKLVSRYYMDKLREINHKDDEELPDRETPDDIQVIQYKKPVPRDGYKDYTKFFRQENAPVEVNQDVPFDPDGPYVIPGEMFGFNPEYDQQGLLYYADGIVTDEDHNIIENVEFTIGEASLYEFEEDSDTIYVRNDKTCCDYEVQKIYTKYSDIGREQYEPQEEDE